MEEKKYVLTDETYEFEGHILHRIKAIRDFSNVEAGDLGGWIESEYNLSHDGTCWIYDNAKVYEDAIIAGSAMIQDDALVHGNAVVINQSLVHGHAQVSDRAAILNDARIGGFACISESARVSDACLVNDDAVVEGQTHIHGLAHINGNAYVRDNFSYRVIGPIGSRRSFITFYRDVKNKIYATTGCFTGTLAQFEDRLRKTYPDPDNIYRIEYESAIQFICRIFVLL